MTILIAGCVDPFLIGSFLGSGAVSLLLGILAHISWIPRLARVFMGWISVLAGAVFALIVLGDGAGPAVILFLLPAAIGCTALLRLRTPQASVTSLSAAPPQESDSQSNAHD